MKCRFLLVLVIVAVSASAFASSDISESDILASGQVGGQTPTVRPYLDIRGFDMKSAGHLAGSSRKGGATRSYPLDLPPALLKPELALTYSSDAGMDFEMPYGWSLAGIAQVRRPPKRGYTFDVDDKCASEFLVSGPGFSGTLKPAGSCRFVMRAADPVYVTAAYDTEQDAWTIHSGGVTWELSAKDDGADIREGDGTATWRADTMTDRSSNYVTYKYGFDHRICTVSYGGNAETGEDHLITVAFAYGDNAAARTSARSGFLTTYDKHVEKITIQSGAGEACSGISYGIGNGIKTGGIASVLTNPLSPAETMSDDVVATPPGSSSIGPLQSASVAKSAFGAGINPALSDAISSALSGRAGGISVSASPGVFTGTDDDDAEDAANRLYAYDLVCTVTDSLNLLTTLEREGKTSRTAETIATFAYGEFDDSEDAARTSTQAPSSLGASHNSSPKYWEMYTVPSGWSAITKFPDGSAYGSGLNAIISSYRPTYGGATASLMDFNRDGLLDVLDASDAVAAAVADTSTEEPWELNTQSVDYDDRTFSWNSTVEIETPDKYQFQWNETEAAEDIDDYFAATSEKRATHAIMDVDGDGYPDQVITRGTEWFLIYYGNGKGFDAQVSVRAPLGWTYAETAIVLHPNRYGSDEVTSVEVKKTLVDMNGDGWLDAFDPSLGLISYHSGTRSGGWGSWEAITQPLEGIRTVLYSLEDIDDLYSSAERAECERDGTRVECGAGTLNDSAYVRFCEDTCESGCVHDKYQCQIECDGNVSCMAACDPDGDFVSECASDCENDYCDDEQRYVPATDEVGGFYDLNGDGLPDAVEAGDTKWSVSFNNGHGFEEAVSWEAPSASIRRTDEGFPAYIDIGDIDDDGLTPRSASKVATLFDGDEEDAQVYQALLDVDGDGLLDLAMGAALGSKWYKNTGAGFETSSRTLPAWWPDSFVVSSSWIYIDNDPSADNDDWKSDSGSVTKSLMSDIDHDGVTDYVTTNADSDGDGPEPPSINSKVYYGPYPPPYVLTEVTNGQGGRSEIVYRSLATVSPAGDDAKTQYAPLVKNLVDSVSSVDGYTGQNAVTSYEYADGYSEDGVFHGLGSRIATNEINGSWTNKEEETFEINRDFEPIATSLKVYADANLNFGPSLTRGSVSESLRYEIADTYDDNGDYFYLIESRKITEYGEKSGSNATTQAYSWDEYGNLKSHTADRGGDSMVLTTFSYVNDTGGTTGDETATFFRMKGKTVSGTDPLLSSGQTIVSLERYYYDGHAGNEDAVMDGLLTRTETQAGWLGNGEALDQSSLAISFVRGTRGDLISATDETTGVKMEQTSGFGGSVVKTQTNGLGQSLTHEIDEQGRVTSTTDPNGLNITTTYDAFHRVTKKQVVDTDGATHTLKTLTYKKTTTPHYTIEYNYNGSVVDETGYAVEDGFGNIMQNWRQDEDGEYLVDTEIFDLRGLLTASSHPEDKGSAFSVPTTSIGVSDTLGGFYYDALGEPREEIRDSAYPTGSRLVYHDSPRQTLTQDEVGYQTKLIYDAHHRVIKVEQGKSDHFVTTATYEYDPMDRMVKFQDGAGVCYAYSYDSAGRLREVKYGKTKNAATASKTTSWNSSKLSSETSSSVMTKGISGFLPSMASTCTASTSWYTYEYKGVLKTKMTDASGAYASWEYDEIGRPKTMTVSDSLPSSTGMLSYTWDYDDAWAGKVYKTTDPSGTTEYAYDELGRIKDMKRSYDPSAKTPAGQTAEFSFVNDLRGNVTSKTFPSGRVLSSTYQYGFLTSLSAATSGATDYTLSYGYNKWGLSQSVTSSTGHKYTNTYTTPLWPDQYELSVGGTSYRRYYEWYKDGLLAQRMQDTGATTSSSSPFASLLQSPPVIQSSNSSDTTVSTKITGGIKGNAVNATPKLPTTPAGIVTKMIDKSATTPTPTDASIMPDGTVITASDVYGYIYDDRMELTQINGPAGITYETYSYDSGGNPKSMMDSQGVTWTYSTAGALNQISRRTPDKTTATAESYIYDQAGRVATWTNSNGTYTYYYDGLGRLRGSTLGGVWQMVLDYDVDGKLVRRGDNNPFTSSPSYVYSFGDWRYDETTGITTENENDLVTTEIDSAKTDSRKWLFKEYDGHVTMTFDNSGAVLSSRNLGGYGGVISSSGTDWNLNSFHGAEDQGEIILMGQRHLMQKDGQWLQPEPLLYSGIPVENLPDPLTVATYRYGRNTPTIFQDRLGMDPVEEHMREEAAKKSALNRLVELHPNVVLPKDVDARAQYSFNNANLVRGDLNCVAVTVAGILNHQGTAATARNASMSNPRMIPEVFGGGSWQQMTPGDMENDLIARGDGAIGAILIQFEINGKQIVHTVYATNDGGIISIHDDQDKHLDTMEGAFDIVENKADGGEYQSFYYPVSSGI